MIVPSAMQNSTLAMFPFGSDARTSHKPPLNGRRRGMAQG